MPASGPSAMHSHSPALCRLSWSARFPHSLDNAFKDAGSHVPALKTVWVSWLLARRRAGGLHSGVPLPPPRPGWHGHGVLRLRRGRVRLQHRADRVRAQHAALHDPADCASMGVPTRLVSWASQAWPEVRTIRTRLWTHGAALPPQMWRPSCTCMAVNAGCHAAVAVGLTRCAGPLDKRASSSSCCAASAGSRSAAADALSARRCGVYEGQSGAPWWVRLDAVTPQRYLVAIQSGYVNTALPAVVIGPRLSGYGGARSAPAGGAQGLSPPEQGASSCERCMQHAPAFSRSSGLRACCHSGQGFPMPSSSSTEGCPRTDLTRTYRPQAPRRSSAPR